MHLNGTVLSFCTDLCYQNIGHEVEAFHSLASHRSFFIMVLISEDPDTHPFKKIVLASLYVERKTSSA